MQKFISSTRFLIETGLQTSQNHFCLLLGSYFTHRSYKCYNPYFLDRTVHINATTQFFLNCLIFHIIYDRTIRMYIGKIREISQTVRMIGPVRVLGN